ncbi:MAG: Asp23/Gls24 family envelope stress response protein [Butyrivibrio sp.]|nr:Asp23/Gls24 family envelope stress response protein [Butyrivibrio sp.]MBQ7430174.1 Asp23/Gls24 family envelope stress response protein [Butyrivibrio sp.]MCR4833493.1 Asp23/Gls24 family envelope stress response protein [Butyrivibrio sp.]
MGNEKESKKTINIGAVKIADDVVARIAALAALEIEGISAIAGNYTTDNLERVGRKNLGKGAKVTVTSGEVRVDLSLVMGYGYNIPTTCSKVQSRVRTSVENMTGLKVTDVNIHVAGISMNQGE